MNDHPLDDGLLVALRSARPDLDVHGSDADDAEALELLERILSSDAQESRDRLDSARLHERHGRFRRTRVRLWVAAAALLLVAVVIPVVATSSQSPNTTSLGTHPAWRLVGNITQPSWEVGSSTGASSFSVVCPSALTCYAVGTAEGPANATSGTVPPPEVEVTNDGGVSWKALNVSGTANYFGAVSCPAVTTCMVAGGVVGPSGASSQMFTTTDGGQSWSAQPLPGQGHNYLLSCATATHCVSLDSQIGPEGRGIQYVSSVTSDGGATWTSSLVPGTFRAYAIQCVTASVCVAAGQAPKGYEITNPQDARGIASVIYSTDGGATWASADLPGDGDVVGALSCADASHCMIIDNSTGLDPNTMVLTSSDSGQTWVAQPSNVSSLSLTHVSCPNPTNCWLTGATTPTRNDPGSAQGILLSTTDGGQTTESVQVPQYHGAALRYVGPIACATSSSCIALAPPPGSTSPFSGQLVLSLG